MTTRDFPLAVVVSLSTGILVHPSFGDMQELAEHVAGHPIWTHEQAEKALWDRLKAALIVSFPWLDGLEVPSDGQERRGQEFLAFVTPWLDELRTRHGALLAVPAGSEQRAESPMASMGRLAPGKPVVVVS